MKFTVVACPTAEGFGVFAVIVVVVLALFTVKLAVPLLVACVVSARNVAVMGAGWPLLSTA